MEQLCKASPLEPGQEGLRDIPGVYKIRNEPFQAQHPLPEGDPKSHGIMEWFGTERTFRGPAPISSLETSPLLTAEAEQTLGSVGATKTLTRNQNVSKLGLLFLGKKEWVF